MTDSDGRTRLDATSVPTKGWKAAEFFAGIGLAGLGLRDAGIHVSWSNDIAAYKRSMFLRGARGQQDHEYLVRDIRRLTVADLPKDFDLAWASFPCTDLSIAGTRAGLMTGTQSSTFWHFLQLMKSLDDSRPPLIVLENVPAFANSHQGRDLFSAIHALNKLGYSVDVISLDAKNFVPQSRQRLFLVCSLGAQDEEVMSIAARPRGLDWIFDSPLLRTHRRLLPDPPDFSQMTLGQIVDRDQSGSAWWSEERVKAFVRSLSPIQLARFEALRDGESTAYRTAFRRMRTGVPRWEMRTDNLAGCLRTSSGGSSIQAVVKLGRGSVGIRWMTPGEYAALMGVPDFPIDDVPPHHAYSAFGDAVCVPVVKWLAENYLVPALRERALMDRSTVAC